ncbi:DUF2017 domain-containing protein [Zhihengliuella sp.]|uniref:DUF2017 domain-containing protein n=1 Tax=Zhihengliuella sp. TaxID=1954483 RepID=UPI0028116123|nr:DUF2017 domain-containing protein [Zhihengliuella sp.]
MARAFKNTRRGVTGHLERAERDLLRNLFDDVITLLEPDEDAPAVPPSSPERDPLWELTGLSPEDFAASAGGAAVEPPRDPALRRLLPDAVKDDDAASAEFRGLTEHALRQSKTASLRAAKLALETSRLHLDDASAPRFAAALNDVRLVLAERLGIETEEDAERVHRLEDWAEAESVDDYLALVYNFVTWAQDSLMVALSDRIELDLDGPFGEGHVR